MDKTKHAIVRCRQRGIREANLELVMALGKMIRKPGGVYEVYVGNKEKQEMVDYLKKCIQDLDRIVGKAVLVAQDGQ